MESTVPPNSEGAIEKNPVQENSVFVPSSQLYDNRTALVRNTRDKTNTDPSLKSPGQNVQVTPCTPPMKPTPISNSLISEDRSALPAHSTDLNTALLPTEIALNPLTPEKEPRFIPYCMQALSPLCEYPPKQVFELPFSPSTYIFRYKNNSSQENTGRLSPVAKLLVARESFDMNKVYATELPAPFHTPPKSQIKRIPSKKETYSFESSGVQFFINSVQHCSNLIGKKHCQGSQVQRFNSYTMIGKTTLSQIVQPCGALNEDKGVKRNMCCSCKKSHCLKLYCECFAAKKMCEGCNCVECHNRLEFYEARENAIQNIEEKNSSAFIPKIVRDLGPSSLRHSRGCHCKKSHCLKKYCECYQNGIYCTSKCQCECCHNHAEYAAKSQFDDMNQDGVCPKRKRKRIRAEPKGNNSGSMSLLSS